MESVRMVFLMVALMLLCLTGLVRSELVDIRPYYSLILEKHNELRRTVSPPASDMREMMWDDMLARDAEKWSQYCQYKRPPRHMYDWGANMFYQRRWVHSWHSIRANIHHGLKTWSKEQDYFQYGTDCGSACSYVQMIYSAAYRVGCAMNKCSQMLAGSTRETYVTLFVCFYAPRSKLIGTYPYRTGRACGECPTGTRCSNGLCAEGFAPEEVRQPTVPETPNTPAVPQPMPGLDLATDALTETERSYLERVHNMLRKAGDCPPLEWNPTLQKWTDWIVTCRADYPGPPHAYTNFARCADHMPVYEVVRQWGTEGMNTDIQLDKGCRTPNDRTQCNHNTNLMQPMLTSMACSACSCGDGMRQLVCVYDNQLERRYRGYK